MAEINTQKKKVVYKIRKIILKQSLHSSKKKKIKKNGRNKYFLTINDNTKFNNTFYTIYKIFYITDNGKRGPPSYIGKCV